MLAATIRRFFDAHGIAGAVVAAVSGGVDSTALLLAINDLEGVELFAAHVNHHLRGADSDEDEAFVRELCARLGIPLDVVDGALDPAAVRARGVEAAAREVRHARLHEVRAATGARWIATAHQKNDQAETIVMRLMTGSGLAALRGIHPVRDDDVIRPLLEVTRAEIAAFLAERGVTPRFDRSNADPRFLRNRVRALLADMRPEVVDNLAALAAQTRAQWAVLERAIDDADRSTTTDDATTFRDLPADAWLRQAILHRHIRRLDPHARDVSAADLERLAAQLDAVRRVSVTKELELVRKGEALLLRRRLEQTPEFEVELAAGGEAFVPAIGLTIAISKAGRREPGAELAGGPQPPAFPPRPSTTQLLELPAGATPAFIVRNRRDGDRFQPLGFPHDKKLKEVLIDRKIDAELRDRIPLLLWNGVIAWVAGVEVSERFRVTGAGDLYEVRLKRARDEDQTGIQR